MFLFGKEYSEKDDLIWKIKNDKIIFINNREYFGEISIQELILDRILIENNKGR